MIQKTFIIYTIGAFIFACQAEAARVQSQIFKVLKGPLVEDMQIGVHVYSLGRKEIVFSHNENKLLKPASNAKLVTTLAALKYLGSNYKFKTKIYTDGMIRGNILEGNLYIKGFGDPKLVSEQLWYLTNDLKRHGFKEVQKNLILDDSFFDDIRFVRNLSQNNNGERAYDAQLGALSINFNTTAIYVRPGNSVGQKAKVFIDPDNTYIKLKNLSKTGKENSPMTIQVSRLPGGKGDTIEVTGSIPLHHPEKRYYRNITKPLDYAAALFRRFFKEQGIIIRGKNEFKPVPPHATELMTYESAPLRLIVADLNKISNNFLAEQILKTMAAELKGTPGTTDKGLEILKGFLKELGIHGNYQLVNGSGLSKDTVMTVAQLVEVLKHGYHTFKVFPEYMTSMGIVGIDGTTEKRLKSTIAEGNVRVKTGSLSEVSGLSGYLQTASDETLAFSIIMNDPKNRVDLMQSIQDKILLILCNMK